MILTIQIVGYSRMRSMPYNSNSCRTSQLHPTVFYKLHQKVLKVRCNRELCKIMTPAPTTGKFLCNLTVCSITLRFIILLYKWSRVTFTELLSAVVKIPWHYHFPWLSMTFDIFHDFPGLENGLPKYHDFPWPEGTLLVLGMPYRIALSSQRPSIALNQKLIVFISVIFVLFDCII